MKLAAVLIIAGLLISFYFYSKGPMESFQNKIPAIDLSLVPEADRPPLNIGDWDWLKSVTSKPTLKDQVIYLNFWAHWCQPCLEEMPLVEELAHEMAALGLVTVLINADTDPQEMSAAHEFIKKFPALLNHFDSEKKIVSDFSVSFFPAHALIDRKGRLAAFWIGNLRKNTQKFKESVANLAAETAATP